MSTARDRIAVWLDDDHELRIPDTPWGRALYADLREVLAAGSHDEWACKGNQRLYQEATAERDRLAETLRLRSAALDRVVAERAAEVVRAEARGKAEVWDEGYDAGHQAARAVNEEWPDLPTNPYRAATIEAEAGACGARLRESDYPPGLDHVGPCERPAGHDLHHQAGSVAWPGEPTLVWVSLLEAEAGER